MEKPKRSAALNEMLGGTEVQRGVKLGIIAGSVEIFLLFGGNAWLRGSAATVDFDRGQITPLLVEFLTGFLALLVGVVLAYYAGLSAPEVKSGETGRSGLLAGALTMLLFWVGQSIYALVDGAGSPQGLLLGSFLRTRLIAGIGFFVVGGMLGWWGSRAAARRARSILMPPTSSSLTLLGSSKAATDSTPMISKPAPSDQANWSEEDSATAGVAEDSGAEEEVISLEENENVLPGESGN